MDVDVTLSVGRDAVPAPADYDGDGSADLAVKDADGRWFIDYASGTELPASSSGSPAVMARRLGAGAVLSFGHWDANYDRYGGADAHPVPADYDGDGKADPSVKNDGGEWHIDLAKTGFGHWDISRSGYGDKGFQPVPADYDGDGSADLAARTDHGDWHVDFATDDFLGWNATWNPDRVAISPGTTVTQFDIRAFDAKWMNDAEIRFAVDEANRTFGPNAQGQYSRAYGARHLSSWGFSDRMSAMAAMYELTGKPTYLAHLAELVDIVLRGRDDRRADSASLTDPFRGRVMPAWGEPTIATAWNRDATLLMAGLYSYPMATFARIVLESSDPCVIAAHGPQAKAVASAVVETYEAFANPDEFRSVSTHGAPPENYWVMPSRVSALLTPDTCEHAATDAYEARKAVVGAQTPDQINTDKTHCVQAGQRPGRPLAHNHQHAWLKALVELSRALDTPRYQETLTPQQKQRATQLARRTLPEVIAGAQRYFQARTNRECGGSTCSGCAIWQYIESDNRISDVSHANLDVGFIALLARDQTRLDAFLPSGAGVELTSKRLRAYANTLLQGVSKGPHLAGNLCGAPPSKKIDQYDDACDGWIQFSSIDAACYEKCEAPILGFYLPDPSPDAPYDGAPLQPHLSPANHASLLATKRYRPGGPSSSPAFRAPPAVDPTCTTLPPR